MMRSRLAGTPVSSLTVMVGMALGGACVLALLFVKQSEAQQRGRFIDAFYSMSPMGAMVWLLREDGQVVSKEFPTTEEEAAQPVHITYLELAKRMVGQPAKGAKPVKFVTGQEWASALSGGGDVFSQPFASMRFVLWSDGTLSSLPEPVRVRPPQGKLKEGK